MLKLTATCLALIGLGACGGGGGSVTEPAPSQPNVEAPAEPEAANPDTPTDQTDPETDPMTGPAVPSPGAIDQDDPVFLETLAQIEANETLISAAALVTDPATGARSVLTRDGLYARADGTLRLGDLVAIANNDVAGDHDNSASFSQADAVGIVGLATPPADLRTTGDARFEGGATGFVIEGASGIDLVNGTSVVDVAFGVGRVTVTLDDFEGVNQITGLTADSPIVEMTLTNAAISGGGFSGGVFTTRDADGSVDFTGANTVTLSQGQFFGLDPDDETPDEVGGIILSQGDSGIVFGTFIAD